MSNSKLRKFLAKSRREVTSKAIKKHRSYVGAIILKHMERGTSLNEKSMIDWLSARLLYIEQVVLVLRIYEGKTLQEVADTLGRNLSYIHRTEQKALQRLKPNFPKIDKLTIKKLKALVFAYDTNKTYLQDRNIDAVYSYGIG